MNEVVEQRILNIDKSDWTPTKLFELAEEISERADNPGQSKYDRFVGLEHFVSGDLKIRNWGSTKYLGSSMKVFKAGDVLFARRNAYLRRASLVEFDGICSGDAFVLRENNEMIVPGFLAFVLNSDELWDYANSNAAGTMSKRVKWRDLGEYEFLLPPKNRQSRLTEFLWSIDELIQSNHDLVENLRLVMKSIISAGCLVLPNKKITLEDVTEDLTAGDSVNCIGDIKSIDQKGVLKTSAITAGEFLPLEAKIPSSAEENRLRISVKKNSILINRKNTPQLVGSSVFIDRSYPNLYLPDLIWQLTINPKVANTKFIWHVISSNQIRGEISSISNGTSFSMVNISQKGFLNVKIPLPTVEKQEQIVAQLDKVGESLAQAKAKELKLKQLQKSLINQIF